MDADFALADGLCCVELPVALRAARESLNKYHFQRNLPSGAKARQGSPDLQDLWLDPAREDRGGRPPYASLAETRALGFGTFAGSCLLRVLGRSQFADHSPQCGTIVRCVEPSGCVLLLNGEFSNSLSVPLAAQGNNDSCTTVLTELTGLSR